MNEKPKGELIIQVLAMTRDTNPSGDIFGGWLLSQMDIAGGVYSQKIAKGRVVTVAIESIVFKHPVITGDILCCYVQKIKTGKTSITVQVEAFVYRQAQDEKQIKVTEGIFTYVKIDENRKPVPL